MKPALLALLSSSVLAFAVSPQQETLQHVLVAEDTRGTGPDSAQPLIDGARSPDTLIRLVSVRGLGRLQRPDLAAPIRAALNDSMAGIRAEAANALVQSLASQRRGIPAVDTNQRALLAALSTEKDFATQAAIAEALGRLRYGDSASAREAERAIAAIAGEGSAAGVIHGLYWLALSRRATGALTSETVDALRRMATTGRDTLVRRSAMLTLGTNGSLDSATVMTGSNDGDAQVRRLALAGIAVLGGDARASLVQRVSADSSPIVRIAAIAAARAGSEHPDCNPIIHATLDPDDYVALTAIDALGNPCSDTVSASAALELILTRRSRERILDHEWQEPAHALVALSKIDSVKAGDYVVRFAQSRLWEDRMFAAVAAQHTHDGTVLRRLMLDSSDNVREAAVTALARNEGHGADRLVIRALRTGGYQVVLAAASALEGTHDRDALPVLIGTFQRLTGERRENARDPRLAVLKRITELGSAANAPELEPYLEDFDTSVAKTVAATLAQWTRRPAIAHPAPLPIRAEPLAQTLLAPNIELRVTMASTSGGGRFTIRLFPREAPATVARIVRLARSGYYNGHQFQRVEPNFVVQGGGPAATEYVGDAAFMRDELGRLSHLRGTLGISSRGRDTGDAQWFINLTDNIRLDHEYTVFGVITQGLEVAERILEDDRIARVEVSGAP